MILDKSGLPVQKKWEEMDVDEKLLVIRHGITLVIKGQLDLLNIIKGEIDAYNKEGDGDSDNSTTVQTDGERTESNGADEIEHGDPKDSDLSS